MTLAVPLLQFDRVSKRFGGIQAVDAVSLGVHAGEVLPLLGVNGAGRSTLIKLLVGIYPADQGEMRFDSQPASVWHSRDLLKQPVAFIHQDLGLVEWMTVAESVVTVLIELPDGSVAKHRREFRGFKRDCRVLAAWLAELQVQLVVMESTGIYWKSVYAHLENAGITALVVNAHFNDLRTLSSLFCVYATVS